MSDAGDKKTNPQDRPGYVRFEGPEIEIFRAGKYPQGEFNEDKLQLIADTYNPRHHEAPITLDHQETGPAFGWIGKIKKVGNTLVAIPSMVSEQLKDLVKSGQYRKVSCELYTDFQGMGIPYLKAVSFLGAKAPAVKGLAPAAFDDSFGKFVSVEFHEKEEIEMDQAALEKLIDGKLAPVVAENASLKKTLSETEAKFAEAVAKGREADAKIASMTEAQKQAAADAHAAEVARFCEDLKAKGQLLPAWEAMGLRAFVESLGVESVVRFSEKETGSQLDFFKRFLNELPKVVRFDQIAKGATGATGRPATAQFDETREIPEREDVAPDSVILRDRACQIEQEKKIPFGEALKFARRELAAK